MVAFWNRAHMLEVLTMTKTFFDARKITLQVIRQSLLLLGCPGKGDNAVFSFKANQSENFTHLAQCNNNIGQ